MRDYLERVLTILCISVLPIVGGTVLPLDAVSLQNGRQSTAKPSYVNSNSKTMPPPQLPSEQHTSNFRRTLRLTFAYEGATVHLLSRMSVEMITPAASPTPMRDGQTGFWYELRDRAGRILYQRAMQNPIQVDAEIFPEDQGRTISRVPIRQPRGTFTLLVPDLVEGDTLVLYSSPLEPAKATAPASEIARFQLKEKPKDEVK
jgi:hypothetical protein